MTYKKAEMCLLSLFLCLSSCRTNQIIGNYTDNYAYLTLKKDSSFHYKKRQGHGISEYSEGSWKVNNYEIILSSKSNDSLSVIYHGPSNSSNINFLRIKSPNLDKRFITVLVLNDTVRKEGFEDKNNFNTNVNFEVHKVQAITFIKPEIKELLYPNSPIKDTFYSKLVFFYDHLVGDSISLINRIPNEFIYWKEVNDTLVNKGKKLKSNNFYLIKVKDEISFMQ